MITVVINGQNYNYPEVNDTEWGDIATRAFDAITKTTLQPVKDLNDPTAINDFTLYNDIDFGPTHGLRVLFIQSRSNNPAASGVFRLAKDELVAWRNEDNDGDNTISFDSDGDLIVNGVKVTLHGQIVNDDIAAAAGIEESKLALDYSTDSLHTAIENHVTDTNNPHSVTKAQILTGDLIVNSDVDSSAAIDESKLNLDYSTDSLNTAITTHVADTNNPHSVTKAQVLTGDLIVNADVDASAAIAESKLALDYSTSSLNTAITTHTGNTSNPHSTSITNLTDTTITSASSGDVLSYDGSKWVNSPSTSASLSGLSDTNITNPANGNTLVFNNVTTKWENSDKLSTVDTTLTSHIGNTSNPHSVTKSQVLSGNPIVNADVDASAAIAESKLSLDYSTSSLNTAVGNVAGDLSNHEGNTSNPHSTSIDNLSDSDIDSDTLTENDVMVFNDQTLKWENSQILVNHIGNAANPHLTTVSKLTDTNISSLADKQLMQYDLANLQWVNSSDVWNQIEVNDIANIRTANTTFTMLSTDNIHQVLKVDDGYDIILPSTGIKTGQFFIFDFLTTNKYYPTTSMCFKASDNTVIAYAHNPWFSYKFTSTVDNPTTSTDWSLEYNLISYQYFNGQYEQASFSATTGKASQQSNTLFTMYAGIWDVKVYGGIGPGGSTGAYPWGIACAVSPGSIITGYNQVKAGTFLQTSIPRTNLNPATTTINNATVYYSQMPAINISTIGSYPYRSGNVTLYIEIYNTGTATTLYTIAQVYMRLVAPRTAALNS